MSNSPEETHGTIATSGPTGGPNLFRNMNNRWYAKQTGTDAAESEPDNRRNLAPWFWGAIAIMAALSILLSVSGMWSQGGNATGPNGPSHGIATEVSASELESLLDTANRAASGAVRQRIGPMLDAAYQPAYDAIPIYANFHYSIWGQYAELGAALIGSVGVKLEETLFEGLDARLQNVRVELDTVFASTFEEELAAEIGRTAASGIGPLTEIAITDATQRMMVSAPVRVVALVGGSQIAAVFARRIAARLSAKAAASVSGRWVAVGTGASGGAVLCVWTGPLAALCAAAGGIAAYLAADYGIIILDEYWNRDDFEGDLRAMIDEQKAEHRVALENAVMVRALEVQGESSAIVEQHDFTLRELSGAGSAAVCRTAADLVSRYDLMRGNLGQRNPGALQALRGAADEQASNFSLRRLAHEINENLKKADQITIYSILIEGNLPPDQRANRDVSGHLLLDGAVIGIPRTRATEDTGFQVALDSEVMIGETTALNYVVALEQHLLISGNRRFGGNGTVEVFPAFALVDGLEHTIDVDLLVGYEESATTVEEVSTTPISEGQVSLSLALRAAPLPELQNTPDCP